MQSSSQVTEVENGQAAKHKKDKSTSFKCAALNIFALEVCFFFFSPQKNWT